MGAKFCAQELEEFTVVLHHHGTLMLTLCVLILAFSVVAILGNLLVIRALRKASSIPVTLKKMFLSLVVSDLAMGLFAQPTFGVTFALMLQTKASGNQNYDKFCPLAFTLCHFSLFLLACASLLNVTIVAFDRLLAISLHLRYQQIVTPNRVNIALVCLWLTSGAAASIYILLPNHNDRVSEVLEYVGLFITTVAYSYIYKTVRYHQNQIQNQNGALPDQAMEVHREQKSSFNVLFIYVVFLVCNLPNLFCALLGEADRFRMSSLVANHVTVFLVLLNSSLNPIIYCWRYREIREIVRSTVKKACPFT